MVRALGLLAMLSCFWCTLTSSRLAHAQAAPRPTLAGTWSATAITERWNIGDWGEACGPKPGASAGASGGQVTIREEGAELAMTGAGRAYKTTDCWEQLPGLARTSHSVSSRTWRTRCASGPGDPRQATVVTTLTATDTAISFDETGEYQFRMQGQNCTASVRRTRTFTLVHREGEAAPAAPPPPPASPPSTTRAEPPPPPEQAVPAPIPPRESTPPPAERCAVTGEPARVEVRPAHKVLRPGEHFTFHSVVVDARGCPIDTHPTWAVVTPGAKVTVSGGMVAIADDATDGHVELTASIGGRGVRLGVEIATPARYEALLAGTQGDGGDADDSVAAVVATGNVGGSMAIAQDTARTRKTLFVVIIGSLALLLAGFGFVMMRRAGAGTREDETASEDAGETPAPSATPGVPSRESGARTYVCPSCRNEFSTGSDFCPHDGNRLVAVGDPALGPRAMATGGICPTCGRGYDPGVKVCPVHGDDLVPVGVYRAAMSRGATPVQRGKICPSCGGRYAGDATFCGKDGTALVLVN